MTSVGAKSVRVLPSMRTWTVAATAVAGSLLYVGGDGSVKVYAAATGKLLRSLPTGGIHWQSPIVAAGRVAIAEGNANDHATTGVLDIYRL